MIERDLASIDVFGLFWDPLLISNEEFCNDELLLAKFPAI